MKTLVILAAAAMLSFAGSPGKEPKKSGKAHDEYCVTIKNGKKCVEHNGRELKEEVKLKDGTKVEPDGTVYKADGSTFTLKTGECVSKDGVMSMSGEKKNAKSDKSDKGIMKHDKNTKHDKNDAKYDNGKRDKSDVKYDNTKRDKSDANYEKENPK